VMQLLTSKNNFSLGIKNNSNLAKELDMVFLEINEPKIDEYN
ncbi:27325_t:CDS:2, partial [Gigaspora margarita]